MLRPAKKHKFRFEYTPITYAVGDAVDAISCSTESCSRCTFPVASNLQWKAYRFGYEYDFISRDRGYVGLDSRSQYTDVQATLSNIVATEFARARAPIPAAGVVGRIYVVPNISLTGEFSGIKWPESINDNYRAKDFDFNFYGTVNFTNNFGVQAGYRSFDME